MAQHGTNLPEGRLLQRLSPPLNGADSFADWMMNRYGQPCATCCFDLDAAGGRSGMGPCGRCGMKIRAKAPTHVRIRCAWLPLYPQWPRLNPLRGPSMGTRHPVVIPKFRPQSARFLGLPPSSLPRCAR